MGINCAHFLADLFLMLNFVRSGEKTRKIIKFYIQFIDAFLSLNNPKFLI